MNWLDVLFEASVQSARTMGLVIAIVVPLVTVFEILLKKKILDKTSKKFSSAMRWFNLPGSAVFPLIVGLGMGIAYGAGVLYRYQQKNILKAKDFNIICTILCLCHSIIEDTVLFTVIGASFVWVFGVRVIIAIIVVKFLLVLGKTIPKLDFFKGK